MTKLETAFHLFNKRYFRNSLPVPILQWGDFKHFGHYYFEDIDTQTVHTIELGKWTYKNKSIWKFTLLHEMCHMKLRDKNCKHHGRLFQQEMKRLASAGAFNKFW